MKNIIICIMLILIPPVLFGYTLDEFNSDTDKLLKLQNRMIKDAIPAYMTVKVNHPILSMENSLGFSGDLSYGEVLAPNFLYNNNLNGVFKNTDNIFPGNGEYLPILQFTGNLALPANYYSTVSLAYFPEMNAFGSERTAYKAGLNIYYRLLNDKSTTVGILTGGGISYAGGSINHPLDLSYDNNVFKGNLKNQFGYTGFKAELFVHKTFFIINWYGRMNYVYTIGETVSSLTGSFTSNPSVSSSLSDNSSGQGLVLYGGMEIILGFVKVNAEAGKGPYFGCFDRQYRAQFRNVNLVL